MKLSELYSNTNGTTGFYNSTVKTSTSNINLSENDIHKIIYLNFTTENKKLILPDATTLDTGLIFVINFINTSYSANICYNSGLFVTNSIDYQNNINIILINNSSSDGEWLIESQDEQDDSVFEITVTGYIYCGYDGSNYLNDCDAFNPSLNIWESKLNAPSPARYYLAASTINDKGYIYCGWSGGPLKDCDEYTPLYNSWISKSDIPTLVSSDYALAASTISNKGYIYCGNNMTICCEFASILNTWTEKHNAPSPSRTYLAASTINDKGYIYCGLSGGSSIPDCDEYTPGSDSWVSKDNAMMICKLAASTINDKGYIYCGYDDTNYLRDCLEYISTSDSWSMKISAPSPARNELAASTINDKGYIYCGYDGNTLQDCDEYTPSLNSWTSKSDVELPSRYRLAASTI